ncbi:MAG: hypothetical protein DWH96_00035 [Planctomycetota bacterium]|nr:MAG: hypothetical protein DWH96_00035 [Planctomycetota bacterium]
MIVTGFVIAHGVMARTSPSLGNGYKPRAARVRVRETIHLPPMALLPPLFALLHLILGGSELAEDRFSVVLPSAKAGDAFVPPVPAASRGRVILFFLDDLPRLLASDPSDGPFLTHPSPIASIAVANLKPDSPIVFDRSVRDAIASFPLPVDDTSNGIDSLNGRYRVQAIFDCAAQDNIGHHRAGNLLSNIVELDLSSTSEEVVALRFETAIEAVPPRKIQGVEWVEMKSTLLSEVAGHDVFLRAGVALPREYHNIDAPRRVWPAVYALPALGETHDNAIEIAPALQSENLRTAFPQAVWVCLDARGPTGQHAFVDSDANGPVTRALVTEFIPFLEQKYRLVAKPEARVLTGNGLGGFACLWLLLRAPDTFSNAFVCAPEPVAMARLGQIDLTKLTNAFVGEDATEIAAFRGILGPQDDRVYMTMREALAMETAIEPHGLSGGIFDTWNAMFCAIDPTTASPRRLIDPVSGAIDPVAANEYAQFDIVEALAANPARIGPILDDRVHILVGSRDSSYAQLGVELLKERLEAWRKSASRRKSLGSIDVLPQRDRDAVSTDARLRFGFAINDWFRSHGLADELPSFDARKPFRTPGVDAPIPGMP